MVGHRELREPRFSSMMGPLHRFISFGINKRTSPKAPGSKGSSKCFPLDQTARPEEDTNSAGFVAGYLQSANVCGRIAARQVRREELVEERGWWIGFDWNGSVEWIVHVLFQFLKFSLQGGE